jgi:hypothetical protein
VLAFLADQLALGEKPAQVFADSALDDMPKSLVIFFDLENHKIPLPNVNLPPAGPMFQAKQSGSAA